MDNEARSVTLRHTSKQHGAYVCVSITFVAATVSLLLRFAAHQITKAPLWYDDLFIILAFFCAMVWSSLMIYWLQNGLGLFLNEIDLSVEEALELSKVVHWNGEIVYACSLAFSKLAMLGFYWRMFKMSRLRVPIQILALATVAWIAVRTSIAIFHCVPVEKFWRPSINGYCPVNDTVFFCATAIVHLVFDLIILALPAIEVRKLQLPRLQRAGIVAMFGFGIFVCLAGVMVIVCSVSYKANDNELPWTTAPIFIWCTVEINLAIVSACLPMLRPIYLLLPSCPLITHSTQKPSSHSKYRSHRPYSTITHKILAIRKAPSLPSSEKEDTLSILARQASMGSADRVDDTMERGNKTVVTGPTDSERDDAQSQERMGGESVNLSGRILVTSETVVKVEQIV